APRPGLALPPPRPLAHAPDSEPHRKLADGQTQRRRPSRLRHNLQSLSPRDFERNSALRRAASLHSSARQHHRCAHCRSAHRKSSAQSRPLKLRHQPHDSRLSRFADGEIPFGLFHAATTILRPAWHRRHRFRFAHRRVRSLQEALLPHVRYAAAWPANAAFDRASCQRHSVHFHGSAWRNHGPHLLRIAEQTNLRAPRSQISPQRNRLRRTDPSLRQQRTLSFLGACLLSTFLSQKRLQIVLFFLIFSGIIIATLWPFSFSPSNSVSWVLGRKGIHFSQPGGVLVSASSLVVPPSSANNSVTIELWLRSDEIWSSRTVVGICNPARGTPFLIRQWNGGLFVSHDDRGTPSSTAGDRIYAKRLFQRGTPLFLTITSSPFGTAIYINAVQTQFFPGFQI